MMDVIGRRQSPADAIGQLFNNKITLEKSNSNWLGCKILKSCEIADIATIADNRRIFRMLHATPSVATF